MTRILLTTPCSPYPLSWGKDVLDLYSSRLQRGQGAFTMKGHSHCWALYLIAENLNAEVTVLEHPHFDEFEAELKNNYDYVGIQFISIATEQVAKMLRSARSIAPEAQTVIGGYGVLSLYDPFPGDTEGYTQVILDNTDHICEEEGVRFFRRLIGDEPVERSITQKYLPMGGMSVRGLEQVVSAPMTNILVALGCPNGCEFCNTSAFFKKKKLYVASPQECFEIMKHNCYRNSGNATITGVFDEDFLIDTDYIRTLGKLIREDEEYGLRKLGYFAFSSLRSMTQYSFEELLECGLAAVWIGVESSLDEVITSEHGIEKRACDDIKATFDALHEYGIITIGSFVLGWDFHTKDNVMQDIEYFVDLAPASYQVAFLTACPGTDFYKRMKQAGRIHPNYKYTDIQVWNEDTFISENFTRNELKPLYDLTHEKLFNQNGPTIMRNVDIHLNGYETCMNSTRRLLREQKAEMFRESCVRMFPVLEACRVHGPTDTAKAKAEEVIEKYKRLLGEPSDEQKMFSQVFCDVVGAEAERLNEQEEPQPSDPPPRWTYYNQGHGPEPLVKKGRGPGEPKPFEYVKQGGSALAL
jgi:haloalkane dehalogenase